MVVQHIITAIHPGRMFGDKRETDGRGKSRILFCQNIWDVLKDKTGSIENTCMMRS
jgi:hypothetical protein